MGHAGVSSSPHRRTQGTFFSSLSFKKLTQNDVSCGALIQRHRFLLTALILLAVLCTVYLYFAVTLGSNGSCAGLLGSERELCRLKHAKATLTHAYYKKNLDYFPIYPFVVTRAFMHRSSFVGCLRRHR